MLFDSWCNIRCAHTHGCSIHLMSEATIVSILALENSRSTPKGPDSLDSQQDYSACCRHTSVAATPLAACFAAKTELTSVPRPSPVEGEHE